MSTLPVLSSSSVLVNVPSITFASILPELPNTPFLQVSVSMTSLFPSGLPYVLSPDPSGFLTWSTQVGVTPVVNRAPLVSMISSSGAWVGGGLNKAISVSRRIETLQSTATPYMFLPVTANAALGLKGLAQHIMLIASRSFFLDNQATVSKLFGQDATALIAALATQLADQLKAMLENHNVGKQIIQSLVDATGPILDMSSVGAKTLTISSNLPSLHLLVNLGNITFTFNMTRLGGKVRKFSLIGPIPVVLNLIN